MFYLNVILIFLSVSLFLLLKTAVGKPMESKSNQTDIEAPILLVIEPNEEFKLVRSVD